MYSRIRLVRKFMHYYLRASGLRGHGIHSPFLFELVTRVIGDRRNFYAYRQVEAFREQLLADRTVLEVEDLGAGSSRGSSQFRTIRSLAKHAAKAPKYGKLLFRLVNYYKPRTILELGTSLGLSTAYLSLGNPAAKLITLEGAPAIAKEAEKNLNQLGITNAGIVNGNFDDTLENTLTSFDRVDFAFIDGNHREEPTLRYFRILLENCHPESILVFDDIHWSAEMESAWNKIKKHPAVTLSVDLFFMGLVFMRKEIHETQEAVIRY